ncbi:hypothetical protein, partial [Thermogutta sp.]|uniref:hypothetical protein n=1 Tax=Thermogutta sp. TaxID=1962930 RepID=UPI00321F6FC5
ACRAAIEWAETQPTAEDIVKNCPEKWRLWALYHPEFLKQCPPGLLNHSISWGEWWKEVNGSDWTQLLREQPQFATLCTEHRGWEKFNGWDWSRLLRKRPQFAPQCSSHGGWNKFDGEDWEGLLSVQPQFAKKRSDAEKL